MPAWCSPRKAYAAAGAAAGSPGRRRSLARPTANAPGHPGGGRAAAEEPASRDVVRVIGQDSTAAVSCDSGSDSALTASESALISSGVSSS